MAKEKRVTTIDLASMMESSAQQQENPVLSPSVTQTGKDLGLRRKPKKKIRVQAMIPPELMEKLQATAEENDASVSEVAAKIIAKYFEG